MRKFGVNGGGHGGEDTEIVHLLEADRELRRALTSDFFGEEVALCCGEAFAEGNQWKREFTASEIGT
jgi:hypothetical protein